MWRDRDEPNDLKMGKEWKDRGFDGSYRLRVSNHDRIASLRRWMLGLAVNRRIGAREKT